MYQIILIYYCGSALDATQRRKNIILAHKTEQNITCFYVWLIQNLIHRISSSNMRIAFILCLAFHIMPVDSRK